MVSTDPRRVKWQLITIWGRVQACAGVFDTFLTAKPAEFSQRAQTAGLQIPLIYDLLFVKLCLVLAARALCLPSAGRYHSAFFAVNMTQGLVLRLATETCHLFSAANPNPRLNTK